MDYFVDSKSFHLVMRGFKSVWCNKTLTQKLFHLTTINDKLLKKIKGRTNSENISSILSQYDNEKNLASITLNESNNVSSINPITPMPMEVDQKHDYVVNPELLVDVQASISKLQNMISNQHKYNSVLTDDNMVLETNKTLVKQQTVIKIQNNATEYDNTVSASSNNCYDINNNIITEHNTNVTHSNNNIMNNNNMNIEHQAFMFNDNLNLETESNENNNNIQYILDSGASIHVFTHINCIDKLILLTINDLQNAAKTIDSNIN
jgi:hypothetical protein